MPPQNKLDRYDLYELCAQAPDQEARFLHAVHGRNPRTLREDFSGPGAIARAWTALHPRSKAIVIDRDPGPLARALTRGVHRSPDDPANPNITAVCTDVLRARDKADVVAALNFALCELHDRATLLKYLRAVRASLNPRGVFVADLYGGLDAYRPATYTRTLRGPSRETITYTWEQRTADQATAMVTNAMHFKVQPPRPRNAKAAPRPYTLPDAFTYHWRLWTIPELRDAMTEAGFKRIDLYDRLGDATDAEGNLYVRPVADGEPLDDNWVAYLAARAASK